MRVALIGCSSIKLDMPARARDLYQGNLFKLSVGWVERRPFDGWGILSAKHGLVMPDQVLAPYNKQFDDRSVKLWAAQVSEQIAERWGRDVIYTLLAGGDYASALRDFPFVEDVFAGWARTRKQSGQRHTGIGILMRELKADRDVG